MVETLQDMEVKDLAHILRALAASIHQKKAPQTKDVPTHSHMVEEIKKGDVKRNGKDENIHAQVKRATSAKMSAGSRQLIQNDRCEN